MAENYVELHARSAFSFLRGGSLPEQLAEAAANSGHQALAICDRMGVYGAPRFFDAVRKSSLRPIIGAELTMEDGSILPVLVESREGYRNLCTLLTSAHLRSAKNEGSIRWDELPEKVSGLVALTGDEEGPLARALSSGDPAGVLERLRNAFGDGSVFVEIQRHQQRGEESINRRLM
jgi:error-prone DNA polymerase